MKTILTTLTTCLLLFAHAFTARAEDGKHLFILSGQSNMKRLDPDISFTPAVEAALGKENVIVVKDAEGGKPIARWYKAWKSATGRPPKAIGDFSLKGLIEQLRTDMKRQDISVVIGRITDYQMENADWVALRKTQVAVAEADPRGAWVDTDDLNDMKNKKGENINDIHFISADGYRLLGERFAQKAIELIKKSPSK